MRTMLGWYSGPLSFEIPSRLIEILPNVKLKLAVLKDPEIRADKEWLWEVSGRRGCNELHVKSFPLQMRELLRRGEEKGMVPVWGVHRVCRRPLLLFLRGYKQHYQHLRDWSVPSTLSGIPSIISQKHRGKKRRVQPVWKHRARPSVDLRVTLHSAR